MLLSISLKIMTTQFFDSIIMLRFGKTIIFHCEKKTIKICEAGFDDTVISKLIETKNNSKYWLDI